MKTNVTFLKIVVVIVLLLNVVALYGQPKALERIPKSNPTNDIGKERKYLGLSIGLDPKNALVGGTTLGTGERRNDEALDVVIRVMAGWDNWEIGVYAEIFDEIQYYSWGMDFNRAVPITRTWILLGGIHAEVVSRNGLEDIPTYRSNDQKTINYGVNLRNRFEALFGSPIFIEGKLNWRYRSDIRHFWGADAMPSFRDALSGYISLGIKF
ncbi:hypothetical protein [Altibacter sp. HG106]|uniref:hypothetical protein n=1 Tax=Altibacter sp. HG106 TaxID=3023937 RepID=UPI0023509E61|nr:hypothetical protein [Altibacter sp. HG106]MDC7994440.1 hypothetical protein [Altibacter sp. HG106]